VRPRDSFTPTAQILRGASESAATHTPGSRAPAGVGEPEVGEHVHHELLDGAHVGGGVDQSAAALPRIVRIG
jgi:hypothetical protein